MAFLDTEVASGALSDAAALCVKMGATQVGLFRTPEGLFAIDNVCPHRGAPLHDGFVHGGAVTCPWHQWDFQLRDGACVNVPNVRVAAYPVQERGGTIWVDLDAKRKDA